MAFGGAFGASTSMFASAPTPAFASQSAFGQQPQSASMFSQPQQSPFGAPSAPFGSSSNTGTRAVPYQLSTLHDQHNPSADPGKYMAISAMDVYADRSFEELRLEDYARNDRGGDQPANTPSNNIFGTQQQNPQSNSLFGAQQPTNPFGASANSASAFASSTPSLFGSQSATPFGAQSSSFAASSASLFGAPQSTNIFGASTPFGAQSASAFGAQSTPAFGDQSQSAFGAQSTSAFGATGSLFGAQSTPAYGATASLFGAQSTPAAGTSLFGSTTPATGLTGATAPATGAFGSFGGGSSAFGAPNTAPSLFTSSSSGLFGGSTGSSLGFGASSGSLFSNPNPGFGSGGLFGGGNTSGSLFASSQPAFGSTSFGTNSFGTGLGSFGLNTQSGNNADPSSLQGPLHTSLTQNPFGDSKLFQNLPPPTTATGPAPSVVEIGATGQSKKVSVVLAPHRSLSSGRARPSHVLARQMSSRRRGPGAGWFYSSHMQARNSDASLFNAGSTNVGNRYSGPGNAQRYYTQWRTPEQIQRAANIKRLVIEPLTEDELPVSSRRVQDALSTPREVRWNRPSSMLVTNAERSALQTMREQSENGNEGAATVTRKRPTSYTPHQSVRSSLRGSGQEENVESVDEEVGGIGRTHDEVDEIKQEAQVEENEEKTGEGSRAESGSGLYAPYSEFYKGQMSASRRRSSLGSAPSVAAHTESNAHVPKYTGNDVYTKPPMDVLRSMTEEQLQHVDSFTYGRKNVGEIRWITPTDVRRLDLDRLVQIRRREISVYPDDMDVPPVGTQLNKPAVIQLEGVWRIDKKTKQPLKDASSTALIVNKLKKHCDQEGLTFLGYDSRSGRWTFQASSF